MSAINGSDSWSIPSDLAPDTDYSIYIQSTADSSVYDYADGDFEIAERALPPAVSISGFAPIAIFLLIAGAGYPETRKERRGTPV